MAEKRRPARNVFLHVEGGVILGAAAVTAAATALPVIGGLGLLGYGITCWNRWQKLKSDVNRSGGIELPGDIDTLDPKTAAEIRAGFVSAGKVLDAINAAPADVRSYFAVAAEKVRELYGRHTQLVRRGAEIARLVAQVDVGKLTSERDRARSKSAATQDEEAKSQYKAAARSLGDSLASYEEMRRDAERIDSQLAAIRANFENVRLKVVRVNTAEARGAASEGVAVTESLDALSTEVAALNKTMDEVYVTKEEIS